MISVPELFALAAYADEAISSSPGHRVQLVLQAAAVKVEIYMDGVRSIPRHVSLIELSDITANDQTVARLRAYVDAIVQGIRR